MSCAKNRKLGKNGGIPYKCRTKIWITDQSNQVLFGMGRIKILEAIEQHGSINAAAKALKMSYRGVWGKINATEERLGKTLVKRKTGGAKGGGTSLTPFAQELIAEFKTFRQMVLENADQCFEQHLSDVLVSQQSD